VAESKQFLESVLLIFGGFFIVAFFLVGSVILYILGIHNAFTKIFTVDVIIGILIASLIPIFYGYDKLSRTREILDLDKKRKSKQFKWRGFLNNTPKEIVVKMCLLAFVSIPFLFLFILLLAFIVLR